MCLRLNHLLSRKTAYHIRPCRVFALLWVQSNFMRQVHSRQTMKENQEHKGYEAAVKALHNLQSNAEAISKARQMLEQKRAQAIPNMNKFILRSGLTEEDVDKLSVIHVSGTKGKGSTCAFCERILHSHGYKTGMFSSPHLVEVRERIRINGRPISKEMFSQYFWPVYTRLKESEEAATAEQMKGMPAYFAFLTVLSLHVFLSERVDVAIMEVGIGGQYDSTNFFRKPAVCGVTSLGLDHTSLLGSTIEDIAWNKAGIFKKGHPAITVNQERGALGVLLSRAQERNSPLYVVNPLPEELLRKYNIHLGIAGVKQAQNASLAIQLFTLWERTRNSQAQDDFIDSQTISSIDNLLELKVSELDDATIQGLNGCVWPGRAQKVCRDGLTYFLDGAHTQESIEVCATWFKEAAEQEAKSIKGKVVRVLVFNITGDRDAKSLFVHLKDCGFDAAVFCTNLLSTVEASNKADQLNKTVTRRFMMDRAEQNKTCWDQLMALEHQASSLNEPLHSTSASTATLKCEVLPDMNANNQFVSGVDKAQVCKDRLTEVIVDVPPTKKAHLDLSSASQSVAIGAKPSEPSHHLLPHTRSLSTSSLKVPSSDRQAEDVRNSNRDCNVNGTDSHNRQQTVTEEQRYARGHALTESGKLNGGSLDPQSSLTFPCILHALAWAAQGRDSLVVLDDPSVVLPDIPPVLNEAAHIQILVTGSLLLVGGVLGVITPDMND